MSVSKTHWHHIKVDSILIGISVYKMTLFETRGVVLKRSGQIMNEDEVVAPDGP